DDQSVRLTTDANGNILTQEGTFPFGEQWYQSGSGNEWVFTNYDRDSESGLDYALARYYDSRTGTFCSADPLAGSPDDPQSWNRYAYGRNDPIDMTDPSGQSFWSDLVEAALFVSVPLTGGATAPYAAMYAYGNTMYETGSALMNGNYVGGALGFASLLGLSGGFDPVGAAAGAAGGIWDDQWSVPNAGVAGALGLPTMADVGNPAMDAMNAAISNNGTTSCVGLGRASAVGPHQAPYTGHSGALYSATQPYSIAGGAMGTVAVQPHFLGLSKAALRQYGNQISISFADNGAIANSGGPEGPYTVSDIGDINIRNSRFDIYRWRTNKAANAFGLRSYKTTITFPTVSGGICPPGWTKQ
ncbi:MAG TPA: RHS repeat-associated core domain-containing protein, partial [Candidatus Aquilonibacter sp.]|nr:RHS repeat-associated core domain-containing protein [Candidatus Aquilonibacter sp.]